MINEYLTRNVKSDATHKGISPPYEHSAWLIIKGCNDKYVWFNGEWNLSEIKDPIKTFNLVAIKD